MREDGVGYGVTVHWRWKDERSLGFFPARLCQNGKEGRQLRVFKRRNLE